MQNIYGNTQGIKSSQLKQLQKFYEERLPGDKIITPEFAQGLATISTQIHQPICCYINRRGQVVRIGVGTPLQTQIPPQELPRHSTERLSGIHCVATQFKSETPDEAALIAMRRQRLDALAVLNIVDGGKIQETFLAHLIPDSENPWIVSPPLSLDDLTEQDFDELIYEWESEISEAEDGTFLSQDVVFEHDRVLLVGVQTDDISPQRFEDGLQELVRLVESASGVVLDIMQQKRSRPHPQTVVGQGKVAEISLRTQKLEANLIVFDRDISPSQVRNLENEIGIVPNFIVKHRQTTTLGFKQHHFYHGHDRTMVLSALDVLPDIPYPSI